MPIAKFGNERLLVSTARVHRRNVRVLEGRLRRSIGCPREVQASSDPSATCVEVGIQSNRPFHLNQDNPNPGTDFTVREADLELKIDRYGTFSFGRGFSAAWTTPEIDLSGTVPSGRTRFLLTQRATDRLKPGHGPQS